MRHYWLTSDGPDLPLSGFRKKLGSSRASTLEKGGKDGGSAPSYPDPMTVANATTQTNEQTAQFNKALNLNNYSNPFGSQQTTQTGTDPNTGAPIYGTQITANPQLQQQLSSLLGQTANSGAINQGAINLNNSLMGQYGGLNQGLQGLGGQLAALGGSLSPQAAQQAQQQGANASYASSMGYLQPQFQQNQESLDAQLANQGLAPGSEAWNNAQGNLSRNQTFQQQQALNQAQLTGSQIGTQNWQNQIAGVGAQSGLLGQQAGLFGQIGSNLGAQGALGAQNVGYGQLPYSNLQTIAGMIPGYSGTSQSAASPADISGLFNNQYQSQLANYNAGQASSNSALGGLFGLGSSALLAYGLSDRRAKRDIRRIGTWGNGLGVYTYRYVGTAKRHIGFMADEVRRIAPHAVMRGSDGFDRVNYVMAVR